MTSDAQVTHEQSGFVYQRCRWCGTTSYRRLLCPVCASTDLEPQHSDGHGVIVRTTVVHRHTTEAHNVSLVRFAEGFMLRCRIIGAPPHLVRSGVRVRPATGTEPGGGEAVFELCDTAGPGHWR